LSDSTTGTILALVSGIFFVALILPIFFDVEYPTSEGLTFIEKSFCTIIANFGGNVTCVVPNEILFFNGTGGIQVTANDTSNTIFFSLLMNGSGDAVTSASNIGSGDGVFAQKILDDLEFKSLTTDGSGILINSTAVEIEFQLEDILIDAISACGNEEVLQWLTGGSEWNCVSASVIGSNVTNIGDLSDVESPCLINEIIKFNTGTSTWECSVDLLGAVDFLIFQAGSGVLQTSIATPARNTITGTNYDWLSLDYSSSSQQFAIFTWTTNNDFDSATDLDTRIAFTTKVAGGNVCFEAEIVDITAPTDWDTAFGPTVTGCTSGLAAVGVLNLIDLNFTSAQHSLLPNDLVVYRLSRDAGNVADTNTDVAEFVAGVVRWDTIG